MNILPRIYLRLILNNKKLIIVIQKIKQQFLRKSQIMINNLLYTMLKHRIILCLYNVRHTVPYT